MCIYTQIPRNNLTVFDLVLVKGFGAKELLRVGGKLPGPGASLRFNVPQSTLMECRDGETPRTAPTHTDNTHFIKSVSSACV